jgi:PAS domain S-box-containing protein
MLNSESEKRSNERLKTLHRRKKKYERVLSNPIKHKEPVDWDDIRQERYKTLIENIPCAVYSAYTGMAGPTTFMSNKWKDWTGYSPEELYHDSDGWSRCIHPDDREHAVNAYVKACRDRMEYNLEYRIVHKDTKQVRYVKDQGRLSKDEKDAVVRVDGIVTDITELKKAKNELDKYKDRLEELVRKRTAELTSAYETLKLENKGREKAEQSLREIEREQTTVLENLSDLIVYRDSDMVTRWASKSMANWHGMSQEQINGRVCYNARYGLDEPCKECHIIDAMKSGRRQELEKQLPGGRCWHVTVNPVFNDSGRVIGTIEVSQDITDRKKAREELEKSKDILEKTFSSLDSAVFILDAQKPPLIIDCNPAATIIFGYGKEEMLGRTTEFLHISREKLLEFRKALNRSIQEQGGLSFFEFKMQRKDGLVFPSEHSVRSLKDDKGRMIGWVSVIRDITERKQQDDLTAIQRDLAIKLSSATELEDGLSLCLEAAIGASEMDCGGIYLIDEGSGALGLAAHSGLSAEFVNHVYQYDKDSDNSRLVMKSEPVYTEHAQLGMVLDQTEKREGLSAIAVIPILNDGRAIGCLNVASHMSKRIHARSRLALETIAAQIGSTVARLKTEESLRKSEELARASLNATNDMVYLVDTSRNILAVNDIAARNLGKTPDELIGTNIFSYFPPDIAKSRGEYGNKVISSGKHVRFQDEREGKFYDVSIYPTFDSQKRVDRLAVFVTDITELKQSEQALRETTDLLETVFEHTHMLVAYLDPQFNFVRVNRAYAEADEHELSFFFGRNHFDLYPNAENEAIFRKVVETGVPYFTHAKPFEYAGHPERGVTYWNWSLVPVKQQDGAACGLILTLADVTEQKRAEQALRESEERFRRIFEEAPIGIATSGADFRFARANAAFCEMMGRTESELRELTFRDITYPEDLSRDIEPIQRLLRGEIPIYRTEKRYVGKGTEIVWGDMTATVVKNEAGQFQCFLIMVEDITERKRAEGALRESEEKFRSLAEQSPNMIFINKKGKVVYANKKCEEIMGYKREELYSPDFDFRTLITPESLDLINDSFTRHLRGQEVQP